MITYNSPITDGSVVCPGQLFRNAPVPVDQASITDALTQLLYRAKGVCMVVQIDGGQSHDSFMTNHTDLMGALDALGSILEQMDAVLRHNSNIKGES